MKLKYFLRKERVRLLIDDYFHKVYTRLINSCWNLIEPNHNHCKTKISNNVYLQSVELPGCHISVYELSLLYEISNGFYLKSYSSLSVKCNVSYKQVFGRCDLICDDTLYILTRKEEFPVRELIGLYTLLVLNRKSINYLGICNVQSNKFIKVPVRISSKSLNKYLLEIKEQLNDI